MAGVKVIGFCENGQHELCAGFFISTHVDADGHVTMGGQDCTCWCHKDIPDEDWWAARESLQRLVQICPFPCKESHAHYYGVDC